MSTPTPEELAAAFPWIEWYEPVTIETPGAKGLGCRICIAQKGIKAGRVSDLPQTHAEFRRHLAEAHP